MTTSVAVQANTWHAVLGSIKRRLHKESFETWFSKVRFAGVDSERRVLRLSAPNQAVRDWVTANYTNLLTQALSELSLFGYSVDWATEEVETLRNDNPTAGKENLNSPPSNVPVDPWLTTTALINSRSEINERHPARAGVTASEISLNTKYTYDSFVVGSCNQFAHAASLAVAEAPGKTYNPLYLYGGVGLGKTHLMHACGNAIQQRNRHLKLCYLSSEKFMNELINAIRFDKTPSFREKYRSVDVLLIDDVQFLAGKERTQEEFFHTFNSLYDQQKQIVISSDCPPREIPTLEERLHSRFEWGLIADIEPPDLETKVAILKRKSEMIGITLPDDVALFIASRVKNNIRELEGSLVRLIAISSLRGTDISKALAQDAIRNIAHEEESEAITLQRIQKVVAAHFRISVDELLSKSNARQFSHPRQIAMYISKSLTKHSYPEIGRAFGGKHHTTVMHSVAKIESLRSRDASIQKLVQDLSQNLQK